MSCDGGGFCNQPILTCNDYNPCTSDSCNGVTKSCEFTAVEGCVGCATNLECDDGNVCTKGTCTATNNCSYEPIANCQPCLNASDCPPVADPCQVPVCEIATGKCQYVQPTANCISCNPADLPDVISATCNDGNLCTVDSCHPQLNICLNSEDLTLPGCLPENCTTNHVCDDGDKCTIDYCDFLSPSKPAK